MKKIYLPHFMIVFLLCLAISGALSDTSKAPEFELKSVEGEMVSLESLLGKGPIVIDFWATWCKPCVEELKHIQSIYEEYRERGLQVLAISQDSPRSVAKVKSFIKGRRFTFPVLLDTNKEVYRKFRLYGLPHTFILDEQGDIVFRRFGYRPGDEVALKEKIEELMGGEEEAASDSTRTDTPEDEE